MQRIRQYAEGQLIVRAVLSSSLCCQTILCDSTKTPKSAWAITHVTSVTRDPSRRQHDQPAAAAQKAYAAPATMTKGAEKTLQPKAHNNREQGVSGRGKERPYT